MHIEVYSDGSATTNDKPGGYGWVVTINGEFYSEGSGHMDKATNNDAELEGALEGLRAVRKLADDDTALAFIKLKDQYKDEYSTVTLVSDSKLILGWANGEYQCRQSSKAEKYNNLLLLVKILNVKTRWVEGHSGDKYNERCDVLANAARTGVTAKAEKADAILNGNTLIGTKKTGTVCLWYKNVLKVVDLDKGIVEDYSREIHGSRGSLLEIREEKSR